MSRRKALRVVAAGVGAILLSASVPGLPAAGTQRSAAQPVGRSGAARIVLYGDSLVSEAGQDFAFLGTRAGAAVQVYTFPGTSPCNYFSSMTTVATSWHPTVAVLAFTGDAFTPCMDGVQVGTASYFREYREQTRTAISTFRGAGATVVLIGQPADASARLTENGAALNRLYQSMAEASRGVVYADAGRAVTAKGRFTWTLPCLRGQPCTGPGRTNVVRSPDGTHFCPNGQTTPDHGMEICDVYSSGAFRFAAAMLQAALAAGRVGDRPVTAHG